MTIKRLRQAMNLNQNELAEKANISVSYLSKIEIGYNNPHVKSLAKIASALGVNLKDLIEIK